MNETELKTAIIILQGCIKVRQDKIVVIEDSGFPRIDDSEQASRLHGEIDDLQLAVEYIKGVL